MFTPPDKPAGKPHQTSPSRFNVKPVDNDIFASPPLQTRKEKENVPVNAIVMEKNAAIPSAQQSRITGQSSLKSVEIMHQAEGVDAEKSLSHVVQEEKMSNKKESRFKASRTARSAQEDKS